MKYLFYLLLILLFSQCKPKKENPVIQFPGKAEVPSSILKTHASLLEQIHQMTLNKDSSGRVALKLEEFMQHHFAEEEDFILPPLGLLPSLARGQMPEQSKEGIQYSEKISSYMNHMSAEHQLINAFIEELKQACDKEQLPEMIEFQKQVIHHATSEEEVFFPASILIGEYLKLKSEIKK